MSFSEGKKIDRDVYYLSTLCQFLVANEKSEMFKGNRRVGMSKRREKDA